jgi:RNA polymerase sigma factor (sigma-70 family)
MNSRVLQDAISGDPSALANLIDKHKDIAFNLAIGIVKNREDAKDITQDSFLKVLENIHKFRNEAKFSTWLYKIVYNLSIHFVQKHGRVQLEDSSNNPHFQHLLSDEYNSDNYEELYRAIEKLEDTEKTLIKLFYLCEKSIKEIRIITGLTISNIKVILHRARKKLTIELEYE